MRGPKYATVQLTRHEVPAGEPLGLAAPTRAMHERTVMGEVELSEGRNRLMFKLNAPAGSDEVIFELTRIILERVK